MGFQEFVEPKKPQGSAVGFLDMIDDDEAALVQQQQKEEEEWLKASVSSLHKNPALLENLVTCMQPVKDAWSYYVPALLTMFREVDEGEALLRFLIDSEVRNTPREATLFREDSVRIQGVQYYILTSVRDWMREVVFKPILRKAVGGRAKSVEQVALDVVRALNDNMATVPSALQQTLTKIGQSVGARFPSLAKTGNKSACVFLFLHVLTPLVVNPFAAEVTTEEIKDRETLLMLAKVGRTIQKWVNVALGDEEGISHSSSDHSLSSHSSEDAPPQKSPRMAPASARLPSGEAEVLRFYELVYKTDGVLSTQKKPDPEECQDARLVLMGVLKKNYKLLRELEAGQDRQSTLNKHLGQQQGKIFASFTRQTTRDDLRASAKFSACPESLNAESVRGEQSMVNSFNDFMRGASGNFMMNGDRYVFMPAAAWSGVATSRFMSDLPTFFSQLNHAQFFTMGLETLRKFARDGHLGESRPVAVLALFPYLALTGWGRFTLGVNSNLTRSNDFSVTVRTENSLETVGIDPKKSGTETRCHALCGFMAGWCTEAMGQSIQGVELQCVGRGDKVCMFLLAPEVVLESQTKRVAADLKSSYVPKPITLSFVAASPGLSESPSRRGRSGEMTVANPLDGVDAIKMCFMREATKAGRKDSRDRGASLTERFRAGSVKKTPEKRERVGTMKRKTSSGGADGSSTPEALGGAAAMLAKKDTPVSSPDSGEVKIADARFVAMRGKDFGSSFVLGAQNLLEVSATPFKRKTKQPNKVPVEHVLAMSKVAMGLLYGYGVCNGESFARQFLENNAVVARNAGAYLDVFADALEATGWGLLSHSSLSMWNEVADDVWIVCHVDNTFESDDRLGNVWDSGSPTCMCMAGAIGGFCSQAFGVRCVCVELECAGCGTARVNKRCSFLCSVPRDIVQRTKLYLAAIGKEDIFADLVGGFRVTVFDEKEDSAKESMANMIKQTL